MFRRKKKTNIVAKATAIRIMVEFFILFWIMIIVLWENTVGFYFRVFFLNAFFIVCFFLVEYWDSFHFRDLRSKLRNIIMNKNESVQ